MSKDDGGPAWPSPGRVHSTYRSSSIYDRNTERDTSGVYTSTVGGGEGMTLRDYFAGQALVGLSTVDLNALNALNIKVEMSAAVIAGTCYMLADAMLKERNKGDKEDG